MKRLLRSLITGALITGGLGIVLSLVILISPTQAGQIGLNSPIDVVATAQAIQARRQQIELEATGQVQQAAWEVQISQLQQTLTAVKRQAQIEISRQEAELITLKTQIKQTNAGLQTTQDRITELQQAIQVDRTRYENDLAALELQMTQIEAQLQDQLNAASAELEATYKQLADSQDNPTPGNVVRGESQATGQGGSEAGG
ncbi:MAG: hypothetical protein AB1801_10995, partial [Chloroflexota bacterium]